MEQVLLLLKENSIYIILGLGVMTLILFILTIMAISKSNQLKNRLDLFMSKDNISLEDLLVNYTSSIETLTKNNEQMQETITKIEGKLELCVQRVGIIRYQAIANTGADLSFAIALLDEHNDGIVLNGIYSRDGSYTYAKPIKNGQSTYNLSEEEGQALQQAMKSM